MRYLLHMAALAVLTALPALAEGTEGPFDPATGLRIDAYRAPVPDQVPGGRVLDAAGVAAAVAQGALLIDALPAPGHRILPDGAWITPEGHQTLPSAHWLPETGRGVLTPQIQDYLHSALRGCAPDRQIVVFCRSDCWMSWNAVQHIAALGFTDLGWYPGGIEDWIDQGRPTEPAQALSVGQTLCDQTVDAAIPAGLE